MILQEWQLNGSLVPHKTNAREIKDLLALADRDLKDCQSAGLSVDWRLNIAYNSALQSATAALAAADYRAARDSHHFRIIQSLSLTIGASFSMVTQFDHSRKKTSAVMSAQVLHRIRKLTRCITSPSNCARIPKSGCAKIIRIISQ